MKILVVEDDVLTAQALKMTLGDFKYTVEVAHDGQAGLDFIEAFDYDLLLLDVLLPRLDGIGLCRCVRSRGYMMPILLLTSKDCKHDRATGLDAGADDYVVKPFEPEELSARIRSLLRRGNDRVQPVLAREQLTLDPSLSAGASTEPDVQIVKPEPTPNTKQPLAPDSLQFLTEIWNRHYAQTLARVDPIERAITAISDGSLTPEISSQAKNSAHTLAGTLGTFGLTLGSQVAKKIELLLTENLELTLAQVSQLQHHTTQLKQEIIRAWQ